MGSEQFGRLNMWAMLRALVNQNVGIFPNAGTPTSGTSGTFAGLAGKGSILIDHTNGVAYINTNTKASPTWDNLQAILAGDISLADGDFLVGNGSNIATARTMSGDVTISNTGVSTIGAAKVLESMLSAVLQGTAEGLGNLRVARATYDFAVEGGTIGAIGLGVTLPDNAIVVGGFVDVITTLTSAGDLATGALSVEGANDIVSAIAINDGSNPWDAGRKAIVPKANTPETTSVKLTAAREVTFTVAVENVTAGKFETFLNYVISS